MSLKFKNGKCLHCGNEIEAVYQGEEIDYNNISLSSYMLYKNIFVNGCPHCSVVKQNLLTEKDIKDINLVLNSEVYNQVLNYADLQGLDTIYENHAQESGASFYDAYAVICLNADDVETEIRALFKGGVEKLKLIETYKGVMYENGLDELDSAKEDFEKLFELIKQSSKDNFEAILELFERLENKNVYARLLKAETLNMLSRKEESKIYFDKVAQNYDLPTDLKEHMSKVLGEV